MAEVNQIELDLDTEEAETEVVDVEVTEEAPEKESDSFDRAENATQKRIDRLTKKMREAERREAEALNYAKQVQGESQQLKSRMANLDTSYVQEYTNRVTPRWVRRNKSTLVQWKWAIVRQRLRQIAS